MYLQRCVISCRLSSEPEYSTFIRQDGREVDYAKLPLYMIKPTRNVNGEKIYERIDLIVHAFERNASSIKGQVFDDFPLIIEFELRKMDLDNDNVDELVICAVKIHFQEQRPPRYRHYQKPEQIKKEAEVEEQEQEDQEIEVQEISEEEVKENE